jgi:glycopeptide antibiotics resistance protein
LTVVVALGLWLAALLFMTLRPAGSRVRLNLVPDLGGADFSAFDTLANVAVFLPLGLVLAAAGWKALPTVGAGLAVSLSVEVLQFVLDVGRAADVNDLITNTAGAALGWAIAWAIRAGRRRRARPTAHS